MSVFAECTLSCGAQSPTSADWSALAAMCEQIERLRVNHRHGRRPRGDGFSLLRARWAFMFRLSYVRRTYPGRPRRPAEAPPDTRRYRT